MSPGGAERDARPRRCGQLRRVAGLWLGLAPAWLRPALVLSAPAEVAVTPSKPAPPSAGSEHPGAAAGVCSPAVQVEGEPTLSAAVASALQARGVRSQPVAGCPLTRVRLQLSELHIVVLLRDEVRHAQRVVADRETAVALIESWVRSDLSAPLLLSSVLPPAAGLAPPESPPAAAAPTETATARASAAVYFEAGGDVSGSPWLGANLRGCGYLFRFCIGGGWRTLSQVGNESRDGRRIATEFLALLALPLSIGRVQLSPSLGLGVSWLHSAARIVVEDSHASLEEPPSSTASSSPSSVAVSADQGQLQAELRLELAIPLSPSWSLSLATAFDATLSRAAAPLVAVPVVKDGAQSSDIVQLSTPPWGLWLGQLGLRWSPR